MNETHEDVNSEVESDSATQNINEILNNSVENAIALFRKVRENGKLCLLRIIKKQATFR